MVEEGKKYNTLIIGGGVAGIGTMVAADRKKALPGMMYKGLAVVEAGKAQYLGQGGLRDVGVNSNTGAHTFRERVRDRGLFEAALNNRHVRRLEAYGGDFAPLDTVVAPFLGVLGAHAGHLLEISPNSDIYVESPVAYIQRSDSDNAMGEFTSVGYDGRRISSDSVVTATGAKEQAIDIGQPVAMVMSHDLLTGKADEQIVELLARNPRKNITILGNGSGGYAALLKLLELGEGDRYFDDRVLLMLSRSPAKLFYPTTQAADQDGYRYDQVTDVCPDTGMVNRSGLRGDAQALHKKILAGEERRVKLRRYNPLDAAKDTINNAAVVVQALGFKPRRIPIRDEAGKEIGPTVDDTTGKVIVDDRRRVIGFDGQPIDGAYAIGLGCVETGNNLTVQDSVDFYHGSMGGKIVTDIMNQRG